MAAGDYRVGIEGKFYYGVAGSQAGTEADNVDDCECGMSKKMAQALRRGKKFVANKPIATEGSISWSMFDIEGDAFLLAVRQAFAADTRLALWPTDAPSGGEGPDWDVYISEFNRTEDNDGFVIYKVKAVPTDEARDPVWS